MSIIYNYNYLFVAVIILFYSCNAPTPPAVIPDVIQPEIVKDEQPRHPDSLWVNQGFAWRKHPEYMQINLSEKFAIYVQNPIQLPNSDIYLIEKFDIKKADKHLFSYPSEAQLKTKTKFVMEINTSSPDLPKLIKQANKRLIVWKVFNPAQRPKTYTLQTVAIENDNFKAFYNLDNQQISNLNRED